MSKFLNTKVFFIATVVTIISGCAANKGDFGTQDVIYPAPTPPSLDNSDELVDDTSGGEREIEELDALMQPGLGFALKTTRRNKHPNVNEPKKDINPEDIQATNLKREELNFGSGSSDYFTQQLAKDSNKYGGYTIYSDFSAKTSTEKELRNLQYVKSGVVVDDARKSNIDYANSIFEKGAVGYVYYQGFNPSKSLPVGQKLNYKGTWDFATNAIEGRRVGSNALGYPGDDGGGTSLNDNVNRNKEVGADGNPVGVGHTSEFQVDFGEKTLTGSLVRNGYVDRDPSISQSIDTMYEIKADLKGNRFRGTATSQQKGHAVFGSDSQSLEGGFYGPNAEELAGKFLADDNSLFTVFTGKREAKDVEDAPKVETLFDATVLEFKDDSLNKKQVDTFGNATTLVINGRSFSLLPNMGSTASIDKKDKAISINDYDLEGRNLKVTACCSNLNYIKFGHFFIGDSKEADSLNYFLMGERTLESVVARQVGTVSYKGSWAGVMTSKEGTPPWFMDMEDPSVEGAGKALLDFDFAAKSFTGELYGRNKTNPTLTLAGSINKNGFEGNAKTREGGFVTDDGSTGKVPTVNINAKVNGGFYGPTAEEVGGVIFSDEAGKDNVAAVFGAKRQVVSKP